MPNVPRLDHYAGLSDYWFISPPLCITRPVIGTKNAVIRTCRKNTFMYYTAYIKPVKNVFWNKGCYLKWQKFDPPSPRKLEFFRISSWECSCSDVRLSSLTSLSRVLSSLLASELLSWTIVRSPSRWFRVSVASLICALECEKEEISDNINNYFDEMSIAFNRIWLYVYLIMS